jgi:hypothetical protein
MSPRSFPAFAALLAAVAAPLAVLAAPALRLDEETFIPLHRTSADFAWIDHASGQLRPGTVNGSGIVGFAASVPTGLTAVTDVASSLPDGAGHAYALASRSVNQVRLVRPAAGHAHTRLNYSDALGPGYLAEIGPASDRRLLVLSLDNSPPASLFTDALVAYLDPKPAAVDRFGSAERPVAAEPLALDSSAPSAVAVLSEPAAPGGPRTLRLVRLAADVLGTSGTLSLPASSRLATGIIDLDGAAIAFVWAPGDATVHPVLVGDPAGTANPLLQSDTAPFAVGLAQAAFLPDGLPAVLLTDVPGTLATLFTIKSAGGLSEQSSFTPPAGQRFHGWLALPGAQGLLALRGPLGSTRPTAYDFHRSTGGAWQITSSGALPAFPDADQSRASLIFFDENPFRAPGSRLTGLADAPDWTSKTDPAQPLPADVVRETFLGASAGLGAPAATPLAPPPGSAYVLPNQYRTHLSVTLPGSPAAASLPVIRLSPPPGAYPAPFSVRADFDAAAYALRHRPSADAPWRDYAGPVPVGYSGTLGFHLVHRATGLPGPLVNAAYSLPASVLAAADTDRDGVPDYVEQAAGLDPAAGSDADGDGRSDLEELLAATDPADPLDFAPAANRDPAFQPAGLRILATAADASERRFAPGELLTAHLLDGARLSAGSSRNGNVDTDGDGFSDLEETLRGTRPADSASLPPGVPTAAYAALERAAALRSATLVPARAAYTLATAARFTRDPEPARSAEVVALLPAPEVAAPAVAFAPSGTDLAADSAGWLAAARIAYANPLPPPALVVVDPASTLRAAAAEALLWSALQTAGPAPAQTAFTLFPARAGDAARTAPTAGRLAALAADGYPVPALLAGVDATFAAFPAELAILDTLAARLVAAAPELPAADPAYPAPLDSLRGLFRIAPADRALPSAVAGLATPSELAAASLAVDLLFNRLPLARRPLGAWTITVGAPDPAAPNRYLRADAIEVELFDEARAPFALQRGLGIVPGTTFLVTGYTDLPGTGGRPAMEVVAASLGAVPLSSDSDADGNLLDDDWERFYFGATGRTAFAPVPGRPYSYLHYFLSGADPRSSAAPAGPAIPVELPPLRIAQLGGGALELRFAWPEGHDERLVFSVLATTNLGQAFASLSDVAVQRAGPDLVAVVPAPDGAVPPRRFYRLGLSLP